MVETNNTNFWLVNLEHSWSRRESDLTLSTGNQTREVKLLYLPRTFPPGIRTLSSDWLTCNNTLFWLVDTYINLFWLAQDSTGAAERLVQQVWSVAQTGDAQPLSHRHHWVCWPIRGQVILRSDWLLSKDTHFWLVQGCLHQACLHQVPQCSSLPWVGTRRHILQTTQQWWWY